MWSHCVGSLEQIHLRVQQIFVNHICVHGNGLAYRYLISLKDEIYLVMVPIVKKIKTKL